MNWLAIIAAFAISLLVGAFLARLLERTRSGWSARRRKWVASLVLPGFILVATIVGIFVTIGIGPGDGENMQDLAIVVIAMVGGVFAAVALGNAIGTVVAIENYGAGDLLEIELENGKRSLIPLRDGIADLADGRVVVDPAFLA